MNKEIKNLLLAVFFSTLTVVAWQYFYESPRKVQLEKAQAKIAQQKAKQQEELTNIARTKISNQEDLSSAEAGKIEIKNPKISGNISLKGLRFDNLTLDLYKQTLDENSPKVKLFSNKGIESYFSEFGWIKNNPEQNFSVPDKNSVWTCNEKILTQDKSINCYWNSGNIKFISTISLDQNYMFTITQTLENNGDQAIDVANYGRIYKAKSEPKQFAILHEGAIGVFDKKIKESTYDDLSKERQHIFTNTPGSWLGFTNKYWLTALIPDSGFSSKTHFLATSPSDNLTQGDVYNVNFITKDLHVNKGNSISMTHLLFTGAKEEKLLEEYSLNKDIKLFDRAIDYGMFYFITKPLLWLMNYFNSLIGNFGLAILLVTLFLKLLMFPLANKSYESMNKMKQIQPKIDQIKKAYSNDKVKFNQEIMNLYKKEKISPAAGCLPLFIQIPLFFSLYKVIFISIEMRHAPFYGWIKDLSAPDPTSIWNLFGLLPWGPIGTLDIGVWPILMAVTMFIQQKLNPTPTDPVQAGVMKFMPLVLLFMLYSLPSGLMIYWSFSNVLSIVQQYMIAKPQQIGKKA